MPSTPALCYRVLRNFGIGLCAIIAGELSEYIEAQRMRHVRGAPLHLESQGETQGKIKRWYWNAEEPHPAQKLD